MQRSRIVNAIGLTCTGVVLCIVLAVKFLLGAWIAILAMAVLFVLMRGIRTHYRRVAEEIAVDPAEDNVLPSRVRAVIVVSGINKPTVRAVNFARASRPSSIEAVTVSVDADETRVLLDAWYAEGLDVPLRGRAEIGTGSSMVTAVLTNSQESYT